MTSNRIDDSDDSQARVERPTRSTHGRRWIVAALTVTALVAFAVLALSGHLPTLIAPAPSTTASLTPIISQTLVPTQTPAPFPAFADWRGLYMRIDGRLHAISPDGARDSAGPALSSSLAPQIGGVAGGGVAPDGSTLAYVANGKLVVGNLRPARAASPAFRSIDGDYTQAFWSPDSATIALCNTTSLALARVSDLHLTDIPLQTQDDMLNLLGWIDGSHLAVVRDGPAGATRTLGSVYIGDGGFRALASMEANLSATFALSPDGAQILYSAVPVRDQTFAPFVDVISTASGQRRHLSAISAALPLGIDSLAWRPLSSLIAVTTQRPGASGAKKLVLIELTSDTATSPLARLPYALGWAPNSLTLIMGDWQPGSITGLFAPHLLNALTIPPTGAPTEMALTDQVVGPFFGFIRTD